jgi:hypothetical protein
MTYVPTPSIKAADSGSIDAFGRWRVSNPKTIFDSKLLFDAAPLFWEDTQISGGSTTTAHSTATACVTLGVAATTAGRRVRQTYQRFDYQPGKSFQIIMTGVLDKSGGGAGINRFIGYGDDNNGLFFKDALGTYQVVRRTKVTGSVVDNPVDQSSWNMDKMDGTGVSGVTLDFSKTNIFIIDFEWLGVGRVRMGFVVDGKIYYCHQFLNANSLTTVYMSTPNLPLRYEIENTGAGAASTMDCICSTVIIEGGSDSTGVTRYDSTGGTHVVAGTAGTIYAVMGIRINSANIGAGVSLQKISMFSKSNDDFEWLLFWNPVVAGTFSYANIGSSAVQTAKGATANVITAGTIVDGGWSAQASGLSQLLFSNVRLGSTIAGTTLDTLVLAVRALGAAASIEGGIQWREGI